MTSMPRHLVHDMSLETVKATDRIADGFPEPGRQEIGSYWEYL